MENFRRCRICISSESALMMSIFGEDALWRKISYFANVEIEEGDNLPQQICVMCAKNAINAFSFKQKCEAADSFFRKQIKDTIDGEVISVSSGEENDNEKEEKKFDKYRLDLWNLGDRRAKSPILVDDSSQHASECRDQQWNHNEEEEVQDGTENHPLIPEIEIITPNDDDKRTANGYQCIICFEFFAMKSILKHHIKVKHPEANPTYECFECKKTYLSKRFLDKHIRRGRCVKKRKNHSRIMQCADCQETFPSGHHLGWHKRAGNCPRQKRNSLNNFTPVPIGPENSESEEPVNENSVIEKENSPNIKKTRRRKWARSKRKGRSRIRLDSNKIELAKQLLQQDASTSKLAQELQISRTYAWKLRKSLNLVDNSSNPESNCPNGKQENNIQNNATYQQQVLNLSIRKPPAEPIIVQNKNLTKIKEKTQENGQPDLRHEGESEEEEESRRDDDEDGEETESADESRLSESKNLKTTPQPGCSQNSLPSSAPISTTAKSPDDNNSHVNNEEEKKDTKAPPYRRRPRKPNVFMTPEKYEQAKQLVSHRATTMEVAKQLNISQMSAWKLRDNILKGIPMTFKAPPIPRPKEPIPKLNLPRPRLKGPQRRERDRRITEEILAMIREDNSIQYWKVSERLAEKGLHLSPSSVCQRLRAMGIHRRWKPNERPTNEEESESGDNDDNDDDDDNSSSLYTDTSQFLSTSFMT